MKQSPCPSAQRIEHLPSWLGQLAAVVLIVACAALSPGQEVRQPIFRQGMIARSISIRVTAGQPRYVVASRALEEGETFSVPLEPPAEIVDYFQRTATQQIEDIDRICQLDKRQKAKLNLAALGDMSRIARESREVREMHSGVVRRDPDTACDDVALVNVHLQNGVLRDGSMFLMVLKSLLTPKQTEQLAQAKFSELSEPWPVELSNAERDQLWQLVLKANDRVADPPILWIPNECRSLVAKLPSAELAGFLNATQIDALQRWSKH
ncbi:MAG: hypothetical protein ABI557_21380 [Aureliella sp.]